jgi:catechol 2,3-dioxygenase-like lactoylglutathione lyase family enzyme
MIQRLSHTTLYVLDQDRAKDFYVGKLGFEVRTDARMGEFRWLTVGPKAQPDLEIVLMPITPGPMLDADRAAMIRQLVEKGTFGGGVLETTDVHKTYEELKAKGVEFMGPPEERPYGIECLMKDDSSNWFSVIQRKK